MQSISCKERQVYPIIFPLEYGTIGSINFYIINDGESLSLIDAGIDHEGCWEFFKEALSEQGFKIEDIERIILTHHHGDHVGLLKRILQLKNMPIYAHPFAIQRLQMDANFFQKRYQFFDKLYAEMDCRQDAFPQLEKLKKTLIELEERKITANFVSLQEGDRISGLEVIATPGHSPDSISLYDDERKWLFTGDLLLKDMSTNAIIDLDQHGDRLKSISDQRHSLQKCSEIKSDFVFPGHRSIIENHKQLVKQKLESMDRKAERIVGLLKDKSQTASSIAKQYYKSKYYSEFSLVMSEIIGYLDYLEQKQLVKKEMVHDVWFYGVK